MPSCFLLFFVIVGFFPATLRAATFNPMTSDEFQAALNTAAANNEADTINLSALTYSTTENTVLGGPTFTFVSTEDHDLILVGLGAGQTILDGGGQHRVLDIDHTGMGDVTLRNLTIQNGNSQGNHRAGLRLQNNNGDTLVEACHFLNNRAIASGERIGGAGIGANPGSITLQGNVFRGNRADDAEGALDLSATSYTFTDNLIEDNRTLDGSFGAVDLSANGPSVMARNSFINNHSENESFGVGSFTANATLEFNDNFFQGNSAMGNIGGFRVVARGIHANANTILENESLTGHTGGAAFFFGNSDDGTFTNNLVVRNSAAGDTGGVLLQSSGVVADVINNTFYGNNAGGDGGGVTLINEFDPSVTNFYNNLSFANQAGGAGQDVFYDDTLGPNSTLNLFNNLFGEFCQANPAGCDPMALGPNQGNNILGQDPLLVDPENDNFYPGPNSPALENADPNAPNIPAQDHDGNVRPTGLVPDIGAFEAIGMISVDPLSHDFGSIPLGQAAQAMVTLTNIGGIPLDITAISLDDPVNFQLDLNGGDSPCGTEALTLDPGMSCTVAVRFLPQAEGGFQAVLTVQSDDPQMPSIEVHFAGTGILPDAVPFNLAGGGCLLSGGGAAGGSVVPFFGYFSPLLVFYLRRRFKQKLNKRRSKMN